MELSARYRNPASGQLTAEGNPDTKISVYSDLETQLFRQARKSTFRVIADRPEEGIGWTGTAFLAQIDGKLVIVTAGHVCHDRGDYALDQEDDLFDAQVIAVSKTTDTCFMTVSKRIETMRPYRLKSRAISYGKVLAAIGHAGGGRLTQYLIRSLGQEEVEIKGITRIFYRADGAVYPGQSGGPVVDNIDGTAVALISAASPSESFITPAADIISEYRKLVSHAKK